MSYLLVFIAIWLYVWGSAHAATQVARVVLMATDKHGINKFDFTPSVRYFIIASALILLAIYLNDFPTQNH